ncbi:TPA: ATP-binding protein [Serratia marcescens]
MVNDVFGEFSQLAGARRMVDNVYTPSRPIDSPEHLKGRDKEVREILNNITVPGRHCMIYGDRGIGKSSLANATLKGVFENEIIIGDLYNIKCDRPTTFSDIVGEAAKQVNVMAREHKEEITKKIGLTARFFKLFETNVGVDKKIIEERRSITPREAAEALSFLSGVILIDEFDVTSDEVKSKVAEFIKQLSDYNSDLKVMIVGISEDGKSLTAGHESVNRCLHEIHLGPVEDAYLLQVVKSGERPLGITFTDKITNEIVEISNGFPYFTHLLCKECAHISLDEGHKCIDSSLFSRAIKNAVSSAEGRLKREYEDATYSTRTTVYKEILLSLARLGEYSFSIAQWVEQIEKDHGVRYSSPTMNNYIGRLSKPEHGSIIKRLTRGIYKVNDPRMPSYIKLVNS